MLDDANKVLVVDDDEVDRRMLARLLSQAFPGVHVREATNLEEGIALAREDAVDCALLDYRLPGFSGFEALEQLRDACPSAAIVIVTGFGNTKTAVGALHEGAQDYLPKDQLDTRTLRQSVNHAVQRRSLERALDEQREALVSFSRILAHDLNAPLRKIEMFVERLGQHLAAGESKRVTDVMERIVRNTGQARATIARLYEYTQPDAEITFEDGVVLDDIVSEVIATLEPDIAQRRARVRRDSLPVVSASTPEMRLLFQNLISNGLKYCDAAEPEIHIGMVREGEVACIEVADNGIGIPEEKAGVVFEPLQRLHPRERYGGGVGLGLSICRKIVERHGGQIWCEPRQSGGTCFRFTLAQTADSPRANAAATIA